MASAKPLMVFCDFDGTITERDMILTVCEKFCPSEWERVKDDIVARRITVKQGLVDLFRMIPSSRKHEIVAFAQSVIRWRAGFPEFLTFCQTQGIAFNVCSGGLDFFIEPLLKPFQSQITKTYCIPARFNEPTIALDLPHDCASCSLCKAEILDSYPHAIKILIGDGVTDVHGAKHANRVYARAGLQKYLDEDGVAYTPFETFHDIRKHLSQFSGGVHAEHHAAR